MSDDKIYSKPGLFGKTILYNGKGEVIGSGTPMPSGRTVYSDVNGNYMGKSYSSSGGSDMVSSGGSVYKWRGGYTGGVTKYVRSGAKPESAGSDGGEAETAKSGGFFSFLRRKPQAKEVPEADFIKTEDYALRKTAQGWFISKYTGENVQHISVPDVIAGKSIVGIDKCAFFGRKELEEVVIPEGIEIIRAGAFAHCRSLKTVRMPDTLKELGSSDPEEETSTFGVFREDRELCDINLPDSLRCIGSHAFYHCTKLQALNIPDGVTEIGDMAFRGCFSLTSIHLPKALREIPYMAFCSCLRLKQIYIPYGVERIGSGAFGHCSELERLYIPDTVTSFGRSEMRDGVPHPDYTIFEGTRRVHVLCSSNSPMLPFLRRARIRHAVLDPWQETEPLDEITPIKPRTRL